MVSLYDAAVPPVIRGIQNTIANLNKVAKEAKSDEERQHYLSSRLHPTMQDLAKQINYITSTAASIPPHLNKSIPTLTLPDECETSFAGMVERLNKVIEYMESIKREDIDGREDVEVEVAYPHNGTRVTIKFNAVDYLFNLAYPNYWFHNATAYGIMRKEGADLGKLDFLNGAGKIQI